MVTEARHTRGPHGATEEEWQAMIDQRARDYLGISGGEFIRRWQAGDFENPDRPEVLRADKLLGTPFGR